MSDDQIKEILKNSKTIAMIGVSSEKKGEDPKNLKRKPANVVMKYMQDFGYKVFPVNPFAEGEVINGETVVASLDKISEKIDIVDIFRPSKETPGFANEAVKIGSKVIWLQYGIQNDEAKKIAEENKIQYVSNRCIKQEYQKLFQKANPVFPALKNSKTIAMIGVSSEKKGEDPKNLKRKPANVVMKYMQDFGYKVIPVNPFAKGEVINGETVIESLDDISEKIDIVDVFRPSKETPGFAKEAAKLGAKTLWLQYGIQNEEAKKISEEANIKYIENKCIKQEYQKLFQKSNPVFPVLKK